MLVTDRSHTGPRQLLNRLIVAALISLVVILSSAGYGINKLYNGFVIDDARDEAVSLGKHSSPHSRHCFSMRSAGSVMMIDLDHFKQINDRYGHPAGDAVLEQSALLLRNSLRSYCHIGRYGGEEFVALLPDTSQQQAQAITERLNQAIQEHPFCYNGEPIALTTSIGAITTVQRDISLTELLSRADANLYQAKAAGRNCHICTPV